MITYLTEHYDQHLENQKGNSLDQYFPILRSVFTTTINNTNNIHTIVLEFTVDGRTILQCKLVIDFGHYEEFFARDVVEDIIRNHYFNDLDKNHNKTIRNTGKTFKALRELYEDTISDNYEHLIIK